MPPETSDGLIRPVATLPTRQEWQAYTQPLRVNGISPEMQALDRALWNFEQNSDTRSYMQAQQSYGHAAMTLQGRGQTPSTASTSQSMSYPMTPSHLEAAAHSPGPLVTPAVGAPPPPFPPGMPQMPFQMQTGIPGPSRLAIAPPPGSPTPFAYSPPGSQSPFAFTASPPGSPSPFAFNVPPQGSPSPFAFNAFPPGAPGPFAYNMPMPSPPAMTPQSQAYQQLAASQEQMAMSYAGAYRAMTAVLTAHNALTDTLPPEQQMPPQLSRLGSALDRGLAAFDHNFESLLGPRSERAVSSTRSGRSDDRSLSTRSEPPRRADSTRPLLGSYGASPRPHSEPTPNREGNDQSNNRGNSTRRRRR